VARDGRGEAAVSSGQIEAARVARVRELQRIDPDPLRNCWWLTALVRVWFFFDRR
jgi:hypothetical protein